MAFPICGAISALATVAGTGLSIAAQNEQRSAANRAMSQELARQRGYQQKASSAFAASLAGSTPAVAEDTIKAGSAERQADYAKARSVPLTSSASPLPTGASSRLVNPVASAGEDQLSDIARARLAGYTEWDMQQAIKNLRANQALAQIGNFSRGSQNILPMELQSAQNQGQGLAFGGGLLSGLGQVGMTAYPLWGTGAKVPTRTSNIAGTGYDPLLGMRFNS